MSSLNGTLCLAAAGTVIALALSSCASPMAKKPRNTGDVAWRAVVDMGEVRYTLKPEQAATEVKPIDNASPIYPPQLVDHGLPPRDIRAKVIVSATGEVTEVRSGDLASVGDPDSRALFNAVVAAVGEWHYNPLLLTDWVDAPDGSTHRVAAKAVPFSMDYIFHFEVTDGAARVAMKKASDAGNGVAR